jgi:hypothetical protein
LFFSDAQVIGKFEGFPSTPAALFRARAAHIADHSVAFTLASYIANTFTYNFAKPIDNFLPV